MTDLLQAADFPPQTRDAWSEAVARVLKGADFDRVLVGRTSDGLRIEPIYPRAESPTPQPGRDIAAPWRVVASLDGPDPKAANELLLADLAGGADAVAIVGPDGVGARGFGLPPGPEALETALAGVMLDLVAIRLDAGRNGPAAAEMLLALADRRGHAPGSLDLELGLDPIGAAARVSGDAASTDDLRIAATRLRGRGFAGRIALADGRPYAEAGASEAQEIAAVLSTALAYLRALEAAGLPLHDARRALSFLLVADADEFLTVAKLRALRRLWAEVETACGLDPEPIRLTAETAWRTSTRRDPWVNLLRGTIAAFSAGIGGADAVSVLPFTAALGLPDGFARRLARNAQHVLLEEANLWRVADPAAGSGAFEALTNGLADEAWSLFTAIEADGGIPASLGSGALPGRIAATRAARLKAVASRRRPMLGTSEYAHLSEVAVSVLAPSPVGRDPAAPGPALPSGRDAEPFEHWRDRSDAAVSEHGRRPTALLLALGTPAEYTPRLTFTQNAFAVIGIGAEVVDAPDPTPEVLREALRGAGTGLACLCSSDKVYGYAAEAAARALRAAGARRIVLAGRPPAEHEAAWREAGIDTVLLAGGDILRFAEEVWPAAVPA